MSGFGLPGSSHRPSLPQKRPGTRAAPAGSRIRQRSRRCRRQAARQSQSQKKGGRGGWRRGNRTPSPVAATGAPGRARDRRRIAFQGGTKGGRAAEGRELPRQPENRRSGDGGREALGGQGTQEGRREPPREQGTPEGGNWRAQGGGGTGRDGGGGSTEGIKPDALL